MSVFESGELATLRVEVQETLTDTCAIQRLSQTSDGAGGQADSWATVATAACRVRPGGQESQERLMAERVQASSPFVFSFAWDTDLTERDQIVFDGQTYRVLGVLTPQTDGTELRAVTERVR